MSGIACADYGSIEERAVNNALNQKIVGVKSFSNHTCTAADARRRRLLSSSIVIETDVTVRDAAHSNATSKDAIVESVQSIISDAVASGELGGRIADEAAKLDPSSPLITHNLLSSTLRPTPAPTPAPIWLTSPHALLISSAFAVVVLVLMMIVYCTHEERAALPKVSVFFISLSVPDFVLDILWIAERSNSPGEDERAFFLWGLAILLIACAVNLVVTLYAIVHEMHENKFNHEKLCSECGGIPSAFILFMSVTNTDALLLLPWKYDDDTKRSFIFEQTGFPSKLVFFFSLFRLIEDGGQAALQTSYLTTHSGSLLTWVSMAFSWASIAYLLIHKFLIWKISEHKRKKLGVKRDDRDGGERT